jgi:NurA-like 5'-3' nuclease
MQNLNSEVKKNRVVSSVQKNHQIEKNKNILKEYIEKESS